MDYQANYLKISKINKQSESELGACARRPGAVCDLRKSIINRPRKYKYRRELSLMDIIKKEIFITENFVTGSALCVVCLFQDFCLPIFIHLKWNFPYAYLCDILIYLFLLLNKKKIKKGSFDKQQLHFIFNETKENL